MTEKLGAISTVNKHCEGGNENKEKFISDLHYVALHFQQDHKDQTIFTIDRISSYFDNFRLKSS